jgi:hypothetical protein
VSKTTIPINSQERPQVDMAGGEHGAVKQLGEEGINA